MRLYTVFELLVIALLIAFGASSVINGSDSKALLTRHRFSVRQERQDPTENVVAVPSGPNKYCTCSALTCNCCRDFALPVVPIKGPGCATVSYVREDTMKITMSFGDRVLRDITVNSKKPKPICMGMPGGISKFCGRLYSIKKDGEHFKACLGLELRALDDVEAALRVSCFRFGPGGVNVEPGEAIPGEKNKEDEDEDDDDDYGLGEFDDDDDDDDDDFGLTGGEDDGDDEENEKPPAKQSTYNDVDSSDDSDYTGLGTLSEEIFGGFFGSTKKRPSDDDDEDDDDDDDDEDYVPPKSQVQNEPQQAQPQVNLVVMNPVIVPTQTVISPKPVQRKPVKKPAKNSPTTNAPKRSKPVVAAATTSAPLKTLGTSTTSPIATITEVSTAKPKNKKKKKPSRRRRPSTPKPTSSTTEATPIVVTTMTVNVVQGSVNLNETASQQYQKPNETPVKVPMTIPVIETKPMDGESVIKNSESSTEAIEVTTQTILQNTIPVDEMNDVKLRPVSVFESSMDKPNNQDNNDEDDTSVDTTERLAESTTNQASTIQEPDSYTYVVDNNSEDFNKETTAMEEETTESLAEEDEEMTMEDESDSEERNDQEPQTTLVDRMDLNPATKPYEGMAEATDKTETIIHTASSVEEQRDSKEDDDDDDDDLDIGADFGLDDDDEEEEAESKKKEPIKIKDKPEEKDDDDDDIFGMLDDEDEDENTRKEEEEDRAFKIEAPYKINPLLFRIARVSAGNIATARHWPRFSEGRNRRNNKRMRFPSLEITT